MWASFQHDPRDPAVAPLRASDADRNVVHGVLTEAFADGRLDREEYDERTAATLQARTLGQLPALVADLVPDRPLLPATRVPLVVSDIQRHPADGPRRSGATTVAGPSSGSSVTSHHGRSGTVFGVCRRLPLATDRERLCAYELRPDVAGNGARSLASEVKRLERKQAKEIEARNKKKQSEP